jgi:hypothetical protein
MYLNGTEPLQEVCVEIDMQTEKWCIKILEAQIEISSIFRRVLNTTN